MIARLGWAIGVVTLVASVIYVAVYLYRWEWNRALFVSMVAVAILVVLSTAVVIRRLNRVEQLVSRRGADDEVLGHLRASAPQRDHFAWLERTVDQHNVFITALLGGGVVVSGLAWLLERLGARTVVPSLEGRLARELGAVRFPREGLVPTEAEAVGRLGVGGGDPALRLLLAPSPDGP